MIGHISDRENIVGKLRAHKATTPGTKEALKGHIARLQEVILTVAGCPFPRAAKVDQKRDIERPGLHKKFYGL